MKINVRSISFRLIVGGCVAVLIPLLIVGGISIVKSTNALREAGQTGAKTLALNISTVVETNLALQKQIVSAFATNHYTVETLDKVKQEGEEAAMGDLAALRQEMKQEYAVLDGPYLGIFVTDTTGLLLTGERDGGKEYKGSNVKTRNYFQEAKQTGKAVAGDIVKYKSTGALIYVVCAPIKNSKGEFLGIFGMSVKAKFLVDIVSTVTVGDTGYAFMSDKNGIINAHPNEDFILSLDLKTLKGMEEITKRMMSGDEGVERYIFKDVEKVAGIAPVASKGWSIAVTQNEEEFLKTPNTIRNTLFLVTVVAMFLVSFAVYFASKGILKPINDAVIGLKDIAEGEGDLTMRLHVTSKDEVGEMAKWFNTFITKLQGIIKQVADNSLVVGERSEQLTAVSETLLVNAEDTSARSNNVATASEEMSANLITVAAAMEESSTSATMVASAAEQMSSTINEIAENAEKARDVSAEAVAQADKSSGT